MKKNYGLQKREEQISAKILSFIQDYFKKTNKKYAIIGVSGGIDSAVTFVLSVLALGKERVIPVFLPSKFTKRQDLKDVKLLLKKYQISPIVFNIDKIVSLLEIFAENKISKANVAARVRMLILYAIANSKNGLVVGTSNKTEILLGYFTKYGDGAADILPLADLYKTDVFALARYLKIPKSILRKKPSPRLWRGQLSEKELGISYKIADKILKEIENNKDKKIIEKKFGKKNVSKIIKRIETSLHKSMPAPICKLNI
jgi:NAD+ synthase